MNVPSRSLPPPRSPCTSLGSTHTDRRQGCTRPKPRLRRWLAATKTQVHPIFIVVYFGSDQTFLLHLFQLISLDQKELVSEPCVVTLDQLGPGAIAPGSIQCKRIIAQLNGDLNDPAPRISLHEVMHYPNFSSITTHTVVTCHKLWHSAVIE